MRQIEKDMLRAIISKTNMNKSNTSVVIIEHENISNVRLHGNLIATVHYDEDKPTTIQIFDGGWRSNTTKSRLNALLTKTVYGVIQKNWCWYLYKYHTTSNFEFENGFETSFYK